MTRDGKYKGKNDSIVTVPVGPELHRKLRIYAAAEGRTIKWIVTDLIERHLKAVDWLAANEAVVDKEPCP